MQHLLSLPDSPKILSFKAGIDLVREELRCISFIDVFVLLWLLQTCDLENWLNKHKPSELNQNMWKYFLCFFPLWITPIPSAQPIHIQQTRAAAQQLSMLTHTLLSQGSGLWAAEQLLRAPRGSAAWRGIWDTSQIHLTASNCSTALLTARCGVRGY